MADLSFHKQERISGRKLISAVFHQGKSLSSFPFRVICLQTSQQANVPVRIAISVPYRNFRKASDRNRIKRLFREAYRKNKEGLYQHLFSNGKTYAILFIYTGKAVPSYKELEQKIILTLQRLQGEL
jgi:ribonuclease P protein component